MGDSVRPIDEAYGEVAALRYNVFESRPTGFANRAAPRVWRFVEQSGVMAGLGSEAGARPLRVLDVGCGTGQLAAYFLERGADVTGLDRSEHMLRFARENNARYVEEGRARFVRAEADNFEFDAPFDVAVSTFNTLNHLADFSAVRRCLSCVRAALVPGGIFLFDVNTRLGLRRTVERTETLDDDEQITVWKRCYEGDRVLLYATGSFLHEGRWLRYRETIFKIQMDIELLSSAILDQGWESVTFTGDDFTDPVQNPEEGEVAYGVARKALR